MQAHCCNFFFFNNEGRLSKTNEPQKWDCLSKAGPEKYKKNKCIADFFPNKRQKIEVYNIVPVTLDSLINEGIFF